MEENDLSNKPNHSVPETQQTVSQMNQIELSNNQTNEAPLINSSFEKKDDGKESTPNIQNSREPIQLQRELNQKLSFNSATNSSNLLRQQFQNMDLNLVKKKQQRGIRNQNSNSNNVPIFPQQPIMNNSNIGLRANLSNPNLNIIPSINLNGNTNSNPNSTFFNPPASMTKNTPNINTNALQVTSTSSNSMPKKEKNKDKKEKNIKKVIKDKKEKPNTKKFHNNSKNRMYSDSDNDYIDSSRSNSRHSNSTGSERSVRRNKEQLQQTSGNPLDVWVMSAPFFKQLPTVADIEKVCGDIDQEMIEQNLNDNEDLPKCKHWTASMKDVVINTLNASHNNYSSKNQKNIQQTDTDLNSHRNNLNTCKSSSYKDYFFNSYNLKKKDSIKLLPQNHSEILYPPEPSPKPTDISSYWLQNSQEFPISDLQMQNYSIIDNILSAFVVAEPDKNHDEFLQKAMIEYKSPFSLQKSPNTETNEDFDASKENNVIEKETQNDCFLPTHVPVPQLEFDDYLSLSFEERLEKELESAGFKKPGPQIHLSNSLAQELDKYQNELAKCHKELDKYKQEVIENLPTYKINEAKRKSEMQNYNEILSKKKKK